MSHSRKRAGRGTGQLCDHVDIAGRETRYTYLPTRRLASVSRVHSTGTNTTTLSYNQQFDTLQITDALERPVESYLLDLRGRATTITNVEGQTMSVSYGIGPLVTSLSRFAACDCLASESFSANPPASFSRAAFSPASLAR